MKKEKLLLFKRLRGTEIAGNSILLVLVVLNLYGCKERQEMLAGPTNANSNENVEKESNFKILSFERNNDRKSWKYEFAVKPGYFLIGNEFVMLAPGIVPDKLADFSELSIDRITVDGLCSQDEFSTKITYRVGFYDGNLLISEEKFGRNWSAVPFLEEGPNEINMGSSVVGFQFGKLEKDGLISRPTIYFGVNLNDMKDKVHISDSIPLWKWKPIKVGMNRSVIFNQ